MASTSMQLHDVERIVIKETARLGGDERGFDVKHIEFVMVDGSKHDISAFLTSGAEIVLNGEAVTA